MIWLIGRAPGRRSPGRSRLAITIARLARIRLRHRLAIGAGLLRIGVRGLRRGRNGEAAVAAEAATRRNAVFMGNSLALHRKTPGSSWVERVLVE